MPSSFRLLPFRLVPCTLQDRVRQARHVARLQARLAYSEWRERLLESKQATLSENKAKLERVRDYC